MTISCDGLLYGVDTEVCYEQHRRGCSLGTTDQRLHACDQFAKIKRLREIVVCSQVQEVYDRSLAFLCSQDQDWSMDALEAHLSQDTLPITHWKHQIENDEVEKILFRVFRSLSPVRRMVHSEPSFAQTGDYVRCKPKLILNNNKSTRINR